MNLAVERVDVWAASIEDKPGGLAQKLATLAEAGADLEFVVARRAPDKPGTGVVFVTPLQGDAQTAAAAGAGFAVADSLRSLRVEGDNRPGIGNRPGIDNRPGIGNRPGIDNRPGIGNDNINIGNRVNIGSGNVIGNRPGWDHGNWNNPGWGWGNNWAGNWHDHCIHDHHGWYNGCWNGGYWGSGWYAPLAWGAVGWGLGSWTSGWGYLATLKS